MEKNQYNTETPITGGELEKQGWSHVNTNWYSKDGYSLWYYDSWVLQINPKSSNEAAVRIGNHLRTMEEIDLHIAINPVPPPTPQEQIPEKQVDALLHKAKAGEFEDYKKDIIDPIIALIDHHPAFNPETDIPTTPEQVEQWEKVYGPDPDFDTVPKDVWPAIQKALHPSQVEAGGETIDEQVNGVLERTMLSMVADKLNGKELFPESNKRTRDTKFVSVSHPQQAKGLTLEDNTIEKWVLDKGFNDVIVSHPADRPRVYLSDAIREYASNRQTAGWVSKETCAELAARLITDFNINKMVDGERERVWSDDLTQYLIDILPAPPTT